jgi:urease accessory protein
MLRATRILGCSSEERFAGRRIERLVVDAAEASKTRLRRQTDKGTDVAIDLDRGTYIFDGAVIADDQGRIIVAERKPEEALVVRLSDALHPQQRLEQAVRLGHAFGNQHVPIEVQNGEIRIPVTTSRSVVQATVEALGLEGAEFSFARVQLGRDRPLFAGRPH